jgi:hypothetical protein
MTSLESGGESRHWDLEVQKVVFCLLERSASNCETACARRISGFSLEAFASATDMVAMSQKMPRIMARIRQELDERVLGELREMEVGLRLIV